MQGMIQDHLVHARRSGWLHPMNHLRQVRKFCSTLNDAPCTCLVADHEQA